MNACIPYLSFDGQAAEAMRTYHEVLGGQLKVLRYADAPGQASPPPGCEIADSQRVMHAMLQFDGGFLMASDTPNSKMAERMGGMGINLTFTDAAKARRVFDALSQGGTIRMPMAKTFWAEAFGAFVDRFGTPWMVNGGLQQVG